MGTIERLARYLAETFNITLTDKQKEEIGKLITDSRYPPRKD